MIKVTIGESKTQEVKEFPKLMKAKAFNFVVLFEDELHGVVVLSEDESRPVAHYRSDWVISSFKEFKESITIQNQ